MKRKRHSWAIQAMLGGKWRYAYSNIRTKREAKERRVALAWGKPWGWVKTRVVKVVVK